MNKTASIVCLLLLIQGLAFAADPPATQPQTVTYNINTPSAAVAASIGHNAVLFIRSEARWKEFNYRLGAATPINAEFPKIDFAKQSVVLIGAGDRRPADRFIFTGLDLAAVPPQYGFVLYPDHRPEEESEVRTTKFILAVIPATPTVSVRVYLSPPATTQPATLEFLATLGDKVGGDIVDGLQASITPRSSVIKPGEDILIDFALHLADPGKAPLERFGLIPTNIFVWDGNGRNGYRNQSFFVTAPDGTTTLLRPKERPMEEGKLNIENPITVTAKQPYHLEGEKSLKDLGLDTTAPGIYFITGLYEETGGAVDKTQMWGGSIASNTITVGVKK